MSDTDHESEFESADEGGGEAIGDCHSESKKRTMKAKSRVSELTVGQTVSDMAQVSTNETEDEKGGGKQQEIGNESEQDSETTRNLDATEKNVECAAKMRPDDVLPSSSDDDVKRNEGWEVDDPAELDCEDQREEGGSDAIDQPREITPTRKMESRTTASANDRSVLDKLSKAAESNQGSSWGWSSWGTSLLSSASSSVATFTTQFEQGLNSVLETVESTLGAPSPEELAAESTSGDTDGGLAEVSERDAGESDAQESNSFGSSIGTLGSSLLTGGLDTLELIGRKTMGILQEGDPGLKKKRSLLEMGKPSLSEVLREAKEMLSMNAEDKAKELIHFGTIFDEEQGLVHLEALEMLSKQCEQKIQLALLDVTGDELRNTQTRLALIEERCMLESVDDSSSSADVPDSSHVEIVATQFEKININVNLEKLLKIIADGKFWLRDCFEEQETGLAKDPVEIHDNAVGYLARFTAKAIEVLHKVCELILVSLDGDLNEEIDHLTGFGNSCCSAVSIQSSKYSSCLNTAADDSEGPDSIGPLITNVYLEASNSTTYIQDAFLLVVPIFQVKLLSKRETS